MATDFWLMVLFAGFVSVVFAHIMHDDPREQVRLGGKLFAGFVAAGVVLGWLMTLLPV